MHHTMPSVDEQESRQGSGSSNHVVSLEGRVGAGVPSRQAVGAKAANLRQALLAGLPVLPGVVLTVDGASIVRDGQHPEHGRVVEGWLSATEALANRSGVPLVIRSSSPAEDSAEESRAGRYVSVVGVVGRRAVEAATAKVIDSGEGTMAVLAQPLVQAATSGVLFGVDPVTGEGDRLVVAAVSGLPERLVSGRASASHYRMSRRGRLTEVQHPEDDSPTVLPRSDLRRLARLARSVEVLFGSPQDVEWAIDDTHHVRLLQSRPVTTRPAEAAGPAIFGTAGVDETFPDALSPLEEDLWVPPLAEGIRSALNITRHLPRRVVSESPIATAVAGQVVVDQRLIGNIPTRNHWFDPRPGFRRITVAWKVGRLRAALVPLAARILARADRSLLSLPSLGDLDDEELLSVLDRASDGLAAIHGTEVLMGMLLPTSIVGPTGLGAAVGLLARLRGGEVEAGTPPEDRTRTDDDLVREYPILLALLPPRIGDRAPLPGSVPTNAVRPNGLGDREPEASIALARESLRLRARWLQEAQASVVDALARSLHDDGVLRDEPLVRMFRIAELRNAVRTGAVPDDLAERLRSWQDSSTPLPGRFQLSTDGMPIAVVRSESADDPAGGGPAIMGQGGGGGRGSGLVVHDVEQAAPGSVLVTATLDPRLASRIGGLAGLVAETGSPLSHLAIVAREQGVPVVVGVSGARVRLAPGTAVVVDGTSGEIQFLDAVTGADRPRLGEGGRDLTTARRCEQ
jgi:rifampicin phosphotransferase